MKCNFAIAIIALAVICGCVTYWIFSENGTGEKETSIAETNAKVHTTLTKNIGLHPAIVERACKDIEFEINAYPDESDRGILTKMYAQQFLSIDLSVPSYENRLKLLRGFKPVFRSITEMLWRNGADEELFIAFVEDAFRKYREACSSVETLEYKGMHDKKYLRESYANGLRLECSNMIVSVRKTLLDFAQREFSENGKLRLMEALKQTSTIPY